LSASFSIALDQSSQKLMDAAFKNAFRHSEATSNDKATLSKIINRRSNASLYLAEIQYNLVNIKGRTLLIFKGKLDKSTLFIADSNGVIVFLYKDWGESYKFGYPYYDKDFFALARVEKNTQNEKIGEKKNINHVFQVYEKSVKNVLTYTFNIDQCINNGLLPSGLKEVLEKSNKNYNACTAKSKMFKFSKNEIYIGLQMVLKQDILTPIQYQQLLKYLNFNKNGTMVYSWKFNRVFEEQPFVLLDGEKINKISGKDLIFENLNPTSNASSQYNNEQSKLIDDLPKKVAKIASASNK